MFAEACYPTDDTKGGPEQEHIRLVSALEEARGQLENLRTGADKLGAKILEFELALLDDNQLTDPVFAHIAGGHSAAQAWQAELDQLISDYQTTDDEMFRSRANDFVDLRDRVLSILHNTGYLQSTREPGAILVSEELTPSRFLEIDWHCYLGVVLAQGSAAGHVAMLARARRVPMIFGLGEKINTLQDGAEAVLDADGGCLIQNPRPQTRLKYAGIVAERKAKAKHLEQYLTKPAATAGGRHIKVFINIDDPLHLETIDAASCDGIGLVRTEMVFSSRKKMPDEEEQYGVYTRLLQWAGDKPVIIRTLDAGGDKPMAGYTLQNESNPFLGVRGIRLSLRRPDVFNVQVRAMVRAAALGPLKVMLPMVTDPSEVNQVRQMMAEQVRDLHSKGVDAVMPQLGIMVEVPVTALRVHAFQADFFSIGSNDLIQYVTAACRDCPDVAALQDPQNPAVLELIRRVVVAGRASGKEVSLCGDMAAVPKYLEILLGTGVTSFSVPPGALALTKQAISQYGGECSE